MPSNYEVSDNYRLVERPFTLSLRDLIEQYEQLTYPVTLVCAGNRRKEQNVVRKSKGFSWGAAGVSTALWTGVAMSEVIRKARPKRGARYVCMEGADKLVSDIRPIRIAVLLSDSNAAKWVLRHLCEIKLGNGPK